MTATTRDDFLLDEATAFDAVASSGDPGQSAYEQVAIRIDTWMQRNPGQTQRDVAARLGKGAMYVSRLLKELYRVRDTGQTFRVDWQSGSNKRPLMPEPELLVAAAMEAIEKAPAEQRRKLVQAMTDTGTVAGRHIDNAVQGRAAAEQRKRDEREPAPATGIPLPAMWASMSVGIEKWQRELSRFTDDDLDELADGNPEGADAVARTVDDLDSQVHRWLSRLRRRPNLRVIEDGVIEGHARQVGR